MKRLFLALLFVSACTTVGDIRGRNRANLGKLEIGMTRSEVHDTMGTFHKRTQSGYRVTNPYRVESARVDTGGTATIMFYYTDMKRADHAITDDELTPVVLRSDTVVGWGQSMVAQQGNEYVVRIR